MTDKQIIYRGNTYHFYMHKVTSAGVRLTTMKLRKNGYKTRTIKCNNNEYDIYIFR